MLIILFGLSGSGKNFVGNVLVKHFGFYFWDTDDALLDEMKYFADLEQKLNRLYTFIKSSSVRYQIFSNFQNVYNGGNLYRNS